MRPLTSREREVAAAMIARANPSDDAPPVTDGERAQWAAHLQTTAAGTACGCGTCPSIELTDSAGVTPEDGAERIVREASSPEGLLLLFVDDGDLSYLELAPFDETPVPEFPDPARISF